MNKVLMFIFIILIVLVLGELGYLVLFAQGYISTQPATQTSVGAKTFKDQIYMVLDRSLSELSNNQSVKSTEFQVDTTYRGIVTNIYTGTDVTNHFSPPQGPYTAPVLILEISNENNPRSIFFTKSDLNQLTILDKNNDHLSINSIKGKTIEDQRMIKFTTDKNTSLNFIDSVIINTIKVVD